MVLIFVPAGILLSCTIYFWIKDLYSHTLQDPEDRVHSLEFLGSILIYLPVALQAIFLFCYACGEAILVGTGLKSLLAFRIPSPVNEEPGSLLPFKIIFIGSLLLTGQYVLLKIDLFDNSKLNIGTRLVAWLLSLLFLALLVTNILHSLSIPTKINLEISYNNDYIWLISILVMLILTFQKRDWMYRTESRVLKYLSLNARILFIYSLLIIVLTFPRIIHSILYYLQS